MKRSLAASVSLFVLAVAAALSAVAVEPPKPVKEIGPERLAIESAVMPLYASHPWGGPLPAVTRAVIVMHGLSRNAYDYFGYAMDARRHAGSAADGTLILVPQFLADEDVVARGLPPTMLRWHWDEWSGGAPAHGPVPLSSYAAVDRLLATLADRSRFPKLETVVVSGFSAGGQVVQRYAAVGDGEEALKVAGVHVRYVVGSPSSYVYFAPERLAEDGRLVPFAGAAGCPGFDRWKYGLAGGLVAYVTLSPNELERRYAARDVVYLLGTADTDPKHRALDIGCAAEAQGPNRYARGLAYFKMMQLRNPDTLKQRLWEVPGIAHDGRAVFNAACGLAALFDKPGCPAS